MSNKAQSSHHFTHHKTRANSMLCRRALSLSRSNQSMAKAWRKTRLCFLSQEMLCEAHNARIQVALLHVAQSPTHEQASKQANNGQNLVSNCLSTTALFSERRKVWKLIRALWLGSNVRAPTTRIYVNWLSVCMALECLCAPVGCPCP